MGDAHLSNARLLAQRHRFFLPQDLDLEQLVRLLDSVDQILDGLHFAAVDPLSTSPLRSPIRWAREFFATALTTRFPPKSSISRAMFRLSTRSLRSITHAPSLGLAGGVTAGAVADAVAG